ncbi:MAG: Type III restriction enzyme, res subunit family [Candidatus Magasanikbacteria bacterium GW2011_GWA2_56_11]|uniref:Type III restriction enzyme, res subunit family n=1 Tax=Candidatus Magasanikbacteria bacterium GW2011_GWA2_56_11 TaxID=1619044 RepID=A0A0G2BAC1_9BACT|nr:MAG: Type III restriction enzyme, res subunit family [Candidatus Magasanikbacteria bacterium GW2011_GWA2_56_11]
MTDGIKTYKTQDLILQIKQNYNPTKLNFKKWISFLDILCGDREYQKEAIKNTIIYLASGEYSSIENLVEENFKTNPELQKRYKSIKDYQKNLPLPHKLSAAIDLATGTGKSYVIYGIAQIALGIGLVDKVLVLCPSLTIESGLKGKFEKLSGDDRIKDSLPNDAVFKNPRIIDANSTIKNGDICVENIHAVYERTGSSINDSLKGNGERVLVLNDEVHHAYNSSGEQDIKKWRGFLLNPDFGFKYIVGLTGTAYIEDEYFNDVIYRYSIRQAVDDKVVKSVEYVSKDESIDKNEKFQKIYDNHSEFVNKYRLIKPLTILITKDISKAKTLYEDFVDYLEKKEKIPRKAVEKKVLIVTSHKDHKKNVLELKNVDDKENSVEWIISVSMLTEGWDVKNVFQIVPWEDRAFNSKLLIAQVLGRGLRIPDEYKTPQPKVRVFNHDAWSRNIRGLIDEILEIEVRLTSEILTSGERSKYHFDLHTIDYEKTEKVVKAEKDTEIFDYSKGYINLVAQVEQTAKETEYEDLSGEIKQKTTTIQKEVFLLDEVLAKIVETFKTRDFEAKIRFPKGEYEKEHLPPENEIREIITSSMHRVGIKSGVLTEDNANRIFKAFQTLFRARGSTIRLERKANKPKLINTRGLEKESIAVGAIKHGSTVFYTENFKDECKNGLVDILQDIANDESLPRSASKEINHYCFKTPVNIVVTKLEPERKFIEVLTKSPLNEKLDAWIKSRDMGFYSIEYSWRKGEHPTQNSFNPDFFLKIGNNIVVVEIKSDDDDSEENKAKYRWTKNHFEDLNEEMEKTKIEQKYFFHFLSPESYSEFTEYLADGRLFKGEFRSSLEDLLEK